MNINCVICSDLLTPSAEVYVTNCGHVFHYECLICWLERKKSCPHCRNHVSTKNITRIYFNVAENESTEDVGSLMNKVDNLQYQLKVVQKDVKIYKEKTDTLKNVNAELRREITTLENDVKTYESTILALKDQISFFKSKYKESDKLNSEINALKQSIKDMENVHIALDGNKEQVNEMLRNETNIESIAMVAAMLKKSLLTVEKKKRELEISNKRQQNDISKMKKELSEIQTQNCYLKKEIQHVKANVDNEKKYLKNKIVQLNKQIVNKDSFNESVDCIVLESPVNFNRTRQGTIVEDTETNDERVVTMEPKTQDSPYLLVKSNPFLMDDKDKSKLNLGVTISVSREENALMSLHRKREDMKSARLNKPVCYDGFGGSSKEDNFPVAKSSSTSSLKRTKSNSTISSSKMRKLAPLKGNSKMSDFLSQ